MHLQDELSRQMFERRIMYSLIDDYKFVAQDKLMEKASQVSGQLIVYGAGNDFKLLSRLIYDFLKKNGRKEEHIINVGAVTGELYRQHYIDVFQAEYLGMLHQYQFLIDEQKAKQLLEMYHYEWNET